MLCPLNVFLRFCLKRSLLTVYDTTWLSSDWQMTVCALGDSCRLGMLCMLGSAMYLICVLCVFGVACVCWHMREHAL